TLAVSVGVLALGVGGFGMVTRWTIGTVALLVAGLGIGLLEVSGNALVVLAAGPRRTNVLNIVHLFFGLGAFAAPALSTRTVAMGLSWRVPFLVAGGIMALIAAAWRAVPVMEAEPPHAAGGSVRGPTYLLAALLAVYVGVETGIG